MADPLTVYFAGEKQGGTLCLVLGVVAVAFSIWVWRTHASFRAMAWPLVLVGVAQFGIGLVLLARTGKQTETLQVDLVRDPAARAKETARMDRVNANFKIVEILEGAFNVRISGQHQPL